MPISMRARPSARALDSDEFVAGTAAAGRVAAGHRSRDLIAVDLAEGGRLSEVARLAISVRDRSAAVRAGGETAVDAVAVGVVRNDEDALLGLGGDTDVENSGEGEDGDYEHK